MPFPNVRIAVGSLVAAMCLVAAGADAADKLTLLTSREEWRVTPVLRAFTAETEIEVEVVRREGDIVAMAAGMDADILLTEEFGPLLDARRAGITQAIDLEASVNAVPAALRDPERHWLALSRHARLIFAASGETANAAITYEDLADPKWRGQICMRSGLHPYNLSLVASMIAHHGREGAKSWLAGVKANLARKPAGNDRAQIRGLAEGACRLAIANSYYLAEMDAAGDEQRQWAAAARPLYPNALDRGSHVTVSGVALMKSSHKRDLATKLIAYLASQDGQQIYAIMQYAYPVTSDTPVTKLAGGETLKADALPLAEIASLLDVAKALVGEVDFDAGGR